MRRSIWFALVVLVALLATAAVSPPDTSASPQAKVRIGICFEGATAGQWIAPSGYGSGNMKGTLFTVRPFRGATLYHLDARTTGDTGHGSIIGWLISPRGERVASVRGRYMSNSNQPYQGEWRVTIYPVQSLSQITDRRHYHLPGQMSGTFVINPHQRATTFSGRFRLCL